MEKGKILSHGKSTMSEGFLHFVRAFVYRVGELYDKNKEKRGSGGSHELEYV